MEKEVKLITPSQDIVENTGILLDDAITIESADNQAETKEDINLLEQINHKLDLLLSLRGE